MSRRAIVRPPSAPPPADAVKRARQIAAHQAHLTRHQRLLRAWHRRLKRAMTEVAKHQKAVDKHLKKLSDLGL